jgi:hypothetical protein
MDDDDDNTFGIPSINIGGPNDSIPQISVSGESAARPDAGTPGHVQRHPMHPLPAIKNRDGLFCGGCGDAIFGRSVSTMSAKWHPGCFRCSMCNQLLENLAMFEHEGRLYCSLDYYEVTQ